MHSLNALVAVSRGSILQMLERDTHMVARASPFLYEKSAKTIPVLHILFTGKVARMLKMQHKGQLLLLLFHWFEKSACWRPLLQGFLCFGKI